MKTEIANTENCSTSAKKNQHHTSLIHRLQHEVNKLINDFSYEHHHFSNLRDEFVGCEAKVDMRDAESKIVVTVEIPGVDLKDLEVTSTPNYLSISGEKKAEKEEKEKNYYRMEREYGYFRRVIPMPCEIESDKAEATFKNGVLTVFLPKTLYAIEQKHQITVKAG